MDVTDLDMNDEPKTLDQLFDYVDLKPLLCYCEGKCPDDQESGVCETKPGGKCFVAAKSNLKGGHEYVTHSYGCLPPNQMGLLQCRAGFMPHHKPIIKCCSDANFCNKDAILIPTTDEPEDIFDTHLAVKLLIGSFVFCFLLFVVAVLFYKWLNDKKDQDLVDSSAMNVRVSKTDNCLKTVRGSIELDDIIHEGKFAEIWLGTFRNERVAVKIYKSDSNLVCQREIQNLHNPLLRHSNIVGYILSDMTAENVYIIMNYYPNKSLRDFLKSNLIQPEELLEMVRGIASGLNHLHREIIGAAQVKKLCTVHNNISSKHILVNQKHICCIADLSQTITFPLNDASIEFYVENIEFTDYRYLAPEFLTNNFQRTKECFTQGDVYSFALVIWEMLNGCAMTDKAIIQYKLPYEDELALEEFDPTRENLVEIVATRGVRPRLNSQWEEHPITKKVAKIMNESWNEAPRVRLSALRISKSLLKLEEHYIKRASGEVRVHLPDLSFEGTESFYSSHYDDTI